MFRFLVLSILTISVSAELLAFDSVMNHVVFQKPGLNVSLLCSPQPPSPDVQACRKSFTVGNESSTVHLGRPGWCDPVDPLPCDDTVRISNTAVRDAVGNTYVFDTFGNPQKRALLQIEPNGSVSPLLIVDVDSYPAFPCNRPNLSGLHLDLVNGTAVMNAIYEIDTSSATSCSHTLIEIEVIQITGLPALLDIILSYQPPSALSFNVPVRPEGLVGADSFSVYAGDVRAASDLSQATPLECSVPAGRPPIPGEHLTVPDPLPAPALGDARYYLAAVNHQGQRRAGRTSVNGVLQGRNAAVLQECP